MKQLDFFEAAKLIKKYDISFANFDVAPNLKSVDNALKNVKFPVVMKVVSPDIIHKTDKGFVKVNINSKADAVNAFKEFEKKAKEENAFFEGVMFQEMMNGKEIIIGGKTDPQFGPVVLFGLGGVFVEVIKDVSLRIAPITKLQAKKMMSEIKGYPIIKGARCEKGVNLDKIADCIVNVSKLLIENPKIKELDLNPLFADERSCIAVDIRMMVD